MTAPPTDNDIAWLAALLRAEITCDPLVCFSCLVAGVRRVVVERDRQWLASEAMRDAAEARLAALKAALKEIERQSDEAIATCDDDGCLCCTTMDDINRRASTSSSDRRGASGGFP